MLCAVPVLKSHLFRVPFGQLLGKIVSVRIWFFSEVHPRFSVCSRVDFGTLFPIRFCTVACTSELRTCDPIIDLLSGYSHESVASVSDPKKSAALN